VTGIREKAKEVGGWINGGFMVMEPEVSLGHRQTALAGFMKVLRSL